MSGDLKDPARSLRRGTIAAILVTSYGRLNFSAGIEALAGPPFRVPALIPILGACGCAATMFMINAGATFIAGLVVLTVYFVMQKRLLTAHWGDMRSGLLVLTTRWAVYQLAKRKLNART